MRSISTLCWPTPDGRAPRGPLYCAAIIGLLLLASAPLAEMNPAKIFHSLGGMWDFATKLLAVPDWSYLPQLGAKLLETFEMAFLATLLATCISLPLAFFAARNSTPRPWVGTCARTVLSFTRALPDLVWALVFVAALGLGPLAGILALAVVTVGFMAKFFAEAIEVVDAKAVEGLTAHNASWLQVRSFAHLPQALPDLLGSLLYILDHNFRAATILGIVGAGGIGYDLVMSMRLYDFPRLLLIMLAILLVVSSLDRLSDVLRRKIT
ncbi:MAG TPA: phosphonate ABC transporter, permease protein PhnE [Pseudomonas sp.]|jgi:phosphonate transport system permease protein|nr:phosphonate ABC transporter, permease protein PhnE [Pseudomonas sp.]